MTESLEGADPVVFACMLHRFENELSAEAFSKITAIQEHIVKLSVRKLAVASDKKRTAFYTICTEQQRLAIEGIKIINQDLRKAS